MTRRERIARASSLGMALVFAAAAALQWNDPDPLIWIAAYAASAALAGWRAAGSSPPLALSASLMLLLAAAALWHSPSVFEADRGAYTAFEMKDRVAEEAREALGLWIAVAYLAWLSFDARVSAGAR